MAAYITISHPGRQPARFEFCPLVNEWFHNRTVALSKGDVNSCPIVHFPVDTPRSSDVISPYRNGETDMQFEPGKTYSTRSLCDHDCIISLTVESRTARTIRTVAGKTLRVSSYDGAEMVRPWGHYSMSPIIDATDITS